MQLNCAKATVIKVILCILLQYNFEDLLIHSNVTREQ